MLNSFTNMDEEVDKDIDNYKFYRLTDEEHLMFHNFGIFIKFTHIFIHKDFSFEEIITSTQIEYKNMLVLLISDLHIINDKVTMYNNPNKFCEHNKYSITRFYNFKRNNYVGWTCKTIRLNSELKLHSKISYFHELIFNIREVCKNEVPEDVITYLLGFI